MGHSTTLLDKGPVGGHNSLTSKVIKDTSVADYVLNDEPAASLAGGVAVDDSRKSGTEAVPETRDPND